MKRRKKILDRRYKSTQSLYGWVGLGILILIGIGFCSNSSADEIKWELGISQSTLGGSESGTAYWLNDAGGYNPNLGDYRINEFAEKEPRTGLTSAVCLEQGCLTLTFEEDWFSLGLGGRLEHELPKSPFNLALWGEAGLGTLSEIDGLYLEVGPELVNKRFSFRFSYVYLHASENSDSGEYSDYSTDTSGSVSGWRVAFKVRL